MPFDTTNFEKNSLKTIEYIADEIEVVDQDCLIEIDFSPGILKLITPKGEYVINKHTAAKQIWLASPISGPYHFSIQDEKWINKAGIDLFKLLSEELSEFCEIELLYE